MKRVKSFVTKWFGNKSEQCCPIDACAPDSHPWFPSPERLALLRMHELEEWQGAEDSDFPRLRKLTIDGCPKLRSIPPLSRLSFLLIIDCPELQSFPSLPSVAELLIENCNLELLFGCCWRCLPALRSLKIVRYSGDTLILPNDGSLATLEKLAVVNGWALRSVEGLGGLRSLQQLEIRNCPLLRMSPDHQTLPPNLQDVKISKSPGADEWYQNQIKCSAFQRTR